MNHKSIKSLLLAVCISLISGVPVLTGCMNNGIADPADQGKSFSGTAAVTVNLGKIGTLAKRSTIEMKRLIIQIRVKATDSVVATDTSDLSDYGETTVSDTFPALSAPDTFTLMVTSIDADGNTIHGGSVDFFTFPGKTVDVSLDLDAKYSMLRVSFSNIPDSVHAVALGIDDVDTLDSSFTAGSIEKVVFEYDYLKADTEGIAYDISLRASGSFYGNDTVLYAADTTIIARSGVDTNYTVLLKWVGPGVPPGAATITVTIGAVGTTSINAGFEAMAGEIPTEGLTAFFPFNGNVNDKSGKGIAAVNHGATLISDRFGKSNSAYSFNGTGNYIDLGKVNPVTGNHFTLSVWIYFTDTVANPFGNWYGATVIMKGDWNSNKEGSYGINISNYVEGEVETFGNTAAWAHVTPIGVPSGATAKSPKGFFSPHKWYHVVCLLSANSLKLYVNGELIESKSVNGQLTSTSLPLAIGRKGFLTQGFEYFFKGRLDDIRIYDQALTDNEVLSLFHENGWSGN